MIRRILIFLGIFIVISLVLLWFIGGGFGRVVNSAKTFVSSGTHGTTTGGFRLPWQPEFPAGVDVSLMPNSEGGVNVPSNVLTLEQEYDDLEAALREAREFGAPSPHRGAVTISINAATSNDVRTEYIRISAASSNTTPVDITGWSLQSALTGVRVFIPRGAAYFLMGIVNEQSNIQLTPGGTAIITSGPSPVGISFRENICSGYLNQLQTFTPHMLNWCPSASEALPLTAENLRLYGDACVNFVETLPSCRTPVQDFTPELSTSCRAHLANILSYNGCVAMFRHRSEFYEDAWRVYLNTSHELWRNTHDVIRLLDAEGRTVDAVTY